jgi:hypothetical protein
LKFHLLEKGKKTAHHADLARETERNREKERGYTGRPAQNIGQHK